MEITGRLTDDAQKRKTTDNRELVAFTVAVNDSYKTKTGEWKEVAEYFSCAYWLNSKIADTLQKGCVVTVSGRVYLNEYKGKDGNHYANIACHVNNIKVIAGGRKSSPAPAAQPQYYAQPGNGNPPVINPASVDDLPF
jgi:single-strand DNA-binding protein